MPPPRPAPPPPVSALPEAPLPPPKPPKGVLPPPPPPPKPPPTRHHHHRRQSRRAPAGGDAVGSAAEAAVAVRPAAVAILRAGRIAPYRRRAHPTAAAVAARGAGNRATLAALGRVVGEGATDAGEASAVVEHRAAQARPAAAGDDCACCRPLRPRPRRFAVSGSPVSASCRWRRQTIAPHCSRSRRRRCRRRSPDLAARAVDGDTGAARAVDVVRRGAILSSGRVGVAAR